MSVTNLPQAPLCFDESNLKTGYREVIQPFWQQQVQTGEFKAKGGVSIAYAFALHPAPIGSVAISSGRIEAYVKYKELVFELFQAGYSVFIHDHRGQGLSGRMTDNPHQGYVEDFDDFVDDFKTFYETVISPHSNTVPKLICHSMGSAIGALYTLKYPEDFAKVVFCAPMFGLRPALPGWVGNLLVSSHKLFNKLTSKSPLYFWGQSDFKPEPFETNELTQSQVRYEIFLEEYKAEPKVQLGGVTGQWLGAAVKVIDEIQRRAGEINLPVLLLQAGADTIVDNGGQDKVFAGLKNAEKWYVEGARHEILVEAEKYREPTMKKVKDFLAG